MIEPEEIYIDENGYTEDMEGFDYPNVSEEGIFNEDEDSYFDSDLDIIDDIDFSEFKGKNFKSSLNKVNKAYSKKKAKKPLRNKPLDKSFAVKKRATLYGKGSENTTKRVLVPSNQKIIIQGVDKFILGDDKCGVSDIGYYKCKKLKELVFTINNNSAIDFNLELFNPSEPLDYLFSTSGNLNNKIQVAGGNVSYTDVLYNIIGNPMHIVNAKLVFASPSALVPLQMQVNEPLIFKNKESTGIEKVEPFQLQLEVDTMQVANDIVFFNLEKLNRPFIPNGMDVIQYKVLAGFTVTFAFYYRQKDLRKLFYEEARQSKKLL